jgi:DNA polymerase-3 subunit epsilon
MRLKLTRPLVFLDCESATRGPSPDPARDKIISIALRGFTPDGRESVKKWFFNPGFLMSDLNVECHGITNEMAGRKPLLNGEYGAQIRESLRLCDLAGYNLIRYDVPLIWEELYRVGIDWDLSGVNIVDAGNIFKLKEERSLSAAVKFYCGREHAGAHDALVDVNETVCVLDGQLERYQDLAKMTVEELARFSRYEDFMDVHGKIIRGPDGDAVFNFSKVRGVKVKDDPGFARWMMGKDFSENTLRVLRRELGWGQPEQQPGLL